MIDYLSLMCFEVLLYLTLHALGLAAQILVHAQMIPAYIENHKGVINVSQSVKFPLGAFLGAYAAAV